MLQEAHVPYISYHVQHISYYVEYKLFQNPECRKKLHRPVTFLLWRVKWHIRYLVCVYSFFQRTRFCGFRSVSWNFWTHIWRIPTRFVEKTSNLGSVLIDPPSEVGIWKSKNSIEIINNTLLDGIHFFLSTSLASSVIISLIGADKTMIASCTISN